MEREAIEDLVIALLAVNSWSLEKVFSLKDQLENEGLFNLESLATLELPQIAGKLERAGYQRGEYLTSLMAERLRGIAIRLTSEMRKDITACIRSRDLGLLERLLMSLPGVGPAVVRQFLMLRDEGLRSQF